MNDRYHLSHDPYIPYGKGSLEDPYKLFKLLFNVAMFLIAAFITVEFSFMEQQNYTMKLTSISIPYQGANTYVLKQADKITIWSECIDALPGERVLFTDYRGSVTNIVWRTEVHDEFKCKQE